MHEIRVDPSALGETGGVLGAAAERARRPQSGTPDHRSNPPSDRSAAPEAPVRT